jgi:hypothetical protein
MFPVVVTFVVVEDDGVPLVELVELVEQAADE